MCIYRYKATISYDGYNYYGFEQQQDLPTIERSLILAFKEWLKEDVKIIASGRTDKMVHAIGQVIHFDLEQDLKEEIVVKALNSFLSPDIRILKVEKVDLNFHARFSAKGKKYIYAIRKNEYDVFKSRYTAFYFNLDLKEMLEGTKYLLGKHNFRSFCSIHTNQNKSFVRTISSINIEDKKDYILFSFVGDGFLKYQIRRMMGLLIEIGKHRFKASYVGEILNLEDPKACQYVAPGNGLYLVDVYY